MKYIELIITADRSEHEKIVSALFMGGFESLMIDDPDDLRDIEEHPEWYKYDYIEESLGRDAGNPTITIYFSDDEEGRKEAERAADIAEKSGASCSISETGDDSEWLYKWQEHFKPTRVGERIVVKPSWENYDAKKGELVVEMDPGMAFGSGLHETTTLCIKALEKTLRTSRHASGPAEKSKVLDVGCGTGILAIAAAKLGAAECLGIDIDADAVRISKENIERNELSDRIKVIEGDLIGGVDFKPDIIVANLMADLVERLSPAAAEHLHEGGIYISSGILDVKCDRVADAVRAAGFEILEITQDGEWCAITARRMKSDRQS